MATVTEALPRTYAQPYSGLWSWFTTVDHKRIGILYGSTAFIFFLIGGIEALLMRVQLMVPDTPVTHGNAVNARTSRNSVVDQHSEELRGDSSQTTTAEHEAP